MNSPTSTRTVVLVAALAIIFPFARHIVSSPLTLLLVSPILIVLTFVAFLVSCVLLGRFLDSRRHSQSNNDLHAVARPFVFSTPAAWQAAITRSQWSHKYPAPLSPLYAESQAVSNALNEIINLIVRDFVLTWYSELSTSPSFPAAVSAVLHDSLERLICRASTIDIPDFLIKRVLPKVTAHVEKFHESEIAVRGAGLERRLTQSEELDLLLASRYSSKGSGKLHSAVNNLSTTFTKQAEEQHLKCIIEKALPFVLPEKEGRSKVLRLVVREIVACAVLYPVMDMLADPDFWNQAIDQIASNALFVLSVFFLFSPCRLVRPYTNSTCFIHTSTVSSSL